MNAKVSTTQYPLLDQIESPDDLRRMPPSLLGPIADEVRRYLIETVSRNGGHFAAGLGAVELAVALHYVYQTPHDRLVWDVGHQAYPHKVLTGRRHRLDTIRLKGGLAPFPVRHESEYDTFGVGHSSTSLSAAMGMAMAAERTGVSRRVVAVIGDGAMSAGISFEALNHIGCRELDVLVVLNDNDMSISEAIGAFSNYLARLLPGNERTIFQDLGLNYVGPVDGHDVHALVNALRKLRNRSGPQFLHVVTTKGKGYAPAEQDPIKWHGPGPFDPHRGVVHKEKASGPTYSQVFGQWACDMAEVDPRVVAITPAMREGSGLVEFSRRFKNQYVDVGIAEQHAVTLAAGLACEEMRPVVAIYSTFLQRAYDQLIHDVALQGLPVVFAIDRAGLVGGDGATHQGSFDVSYLRCVPNLTIMAPADENECRQMLYTALSSNGPVAVRYPKGQGPGVKIEQQMTRLPIGKAQLRRSGRHGVALLAFGSLVSTAELIGARHDMTVVNMRYIKPLDEAAVLAIAAEHEGIVTLEESTIAGGAGSAVNELLHAAGMPTRVLNCGIPDCFIEHGSREECLAAAGLSPAALESAITRWWREIRGLVEVPYAS